MLITRIFFEKAAIFAVYKKTSILSSVHISSVTFQKKNLTPFPPQVNHYNTPVSLLRWDLAVWNKSRPLCWRKYPQNFILVGKYMKIHPNLEKNQSFEAAILTGFIKLKTIEFEIPCNLHPHWYLNPSFYPYWRTWRTNFHHFHQWDWGVLCIYRQWFIRNTEILRNWEHFFHC